MPTIPASTTFEFNGVVYGASGDCKYAGPHFEFEGVANLSITRFGARVDEPGEQLVQVAEDALEVEADEELQELLDSGFGSPSYDRDDDYYDYDRNYSSGPDYWVDRESGEYRCG
jgi:hypothetical protein